ncbi:hypothetical protein GBA65_09660 [Rubrobacter marinus]|uniref:PNPLA domain-containing protein n=1 Tax=Rubrobacter marinus TaxID=2653852 RepID=A0A6G8PX20_9ACTN|nr:hypothetical protein GBA65_09660 [Rubrobacter marinus]
MRWTNPETEAEHLVADGGMSSNFPVWLFDAPGTGYELGVLGYLRALADTMIEEHDRLYLEEHDFVRTVPIDTLGGRTCGGRPLAGARGRPPQVRALRRETLPE